MTGEASMILPASGKGFQVVPPCMTHNCQSSLQQAHVTAPSLTLPATDKARRLSCQLCARWDEFFGNCTGCQVDFIATHLYTCSPQYLQWCAPLTPSHASLCTSNAHLESA